MDSETFYRVLLDRLLGVDRLLLSTHRNPDPDGIGAEIGLEFLLRQKGKDCLVLNHDPLSAKLRFLDPGGIILSFPERPPEPQLRDRTVVFLDNSDIARSGEIEQWIASDRSNLIVIDHHDGITSDMKTYFLRPDIGSTSEIVQELIEFSGLSITSAVAQALYAGLVTDTGHFRYRKTRPESHRLAARLLELGVDPPVVAERLASGFPVGRLLARRTVYDTLQVNAAETMAWIVIQRKDLQEYNVTFEDLDGLVNELLEPDQIQIAMVFVVREAGKTKVSLRSKGDVNLLPAVHAYGGGGHKNACGATIPLELHNALREFLPVVERCLP